MKTLHSLLFIALALFFTNVAMAQSCPCQLSIVDLKTQQQINDFAINHPGCTEIYANVYIGSNNATPNTDIVNLNGLSQITRICGSVTIKGCANLQNVDGLSSLTYLGNSLDISQSPLLTTLHGLQNLDSIDGRLTIWSNPGLINLQGLENLAYIAGDIWIWDNISLQTIGALGNGSGKRSSILVFNDIEVSNNPMLSDCATLSTCAAIADTNNTITIMNNAVGCNSLAEVQSDCLALSVDNKVTNTMRYYPSLVTENLTIETEQPTTVHLINIAGKPVRQNIALDQGFNKLDLSELSEGMYFVISNDGSSIRIIKQ